MSRRRHSEDMPIMESPLAPQLELSEGETIAIISPSGSSGIRRMSNGTRSGSARNDPRYHLGPKDDGLYHCPFEGDGTCNHKPTNLKCNYE